MYAKIVFNIYINKIYVVKIVLYVHVIICYTIDFEVNFLFVCKDETFHFVDFHIQVLNY